MTCRCASLPDAFYLSEAPFRFATRLTREATGDWMWLGACPTCGTLWSLDEDDKYQEPAVTRVRSREGWDGEAGTCLRKHLLLESRGGLSDAECMRAGCHARAVSGVAYCLDHLWQTGARR